MRDAPRRACCRTLDRSLDARLFRALGDANRLDMLVRLAGCRGSCTVGEIAACFRIDLSVVSRHLAALREAGVLTAEKRGKEVHYRLDHQAVAGRLRAIANAVDACCPADCC